MSYLDAWTNGFEDGKNLQLKLINEFTESEFKALVEVIAFIREAKSIKEEANAQD